MEVVMQNRISQRSHGLRNLIVTAVLWLITSLIALWEILLIRDIGIALFLRYASRNMNAPDYILTGQANVIGQLFVILGAIVAILIVPAGADFHYRYFGKPASWRMFAYVLCFQLIVFTLASVI